MFFRRRTFRAALFFLIASLYCTCIRAQEVGYLDTTHSRIRQRQREPNSGTSGGIVAGYSDGRSPSNAPLTLSLATDGNRELGLGETFEYQVQIRNDSSQIIELPWDLSPADIEPETIGATYQYEMVAVYLQADLGQGRRITIQSSVLLFGSPSIASTTVKLRPGEWLRVKAKGHLVSANPSDVWPSKAGRDNVRITLTATLTLYSNTFSTVSAGNSHEESRVAMGPIFSNAKTVQSHF